uniref:WD_REPEATS_REGION domain-containing protein n=1 Tax=Meloidogyne hapla TaxID=6305 RepID=A0A1I8B3V3_MELHA
MFLVFLSRAPPINLNKTSELVHIPLILDLPPSPPPPEPEPSSMKTEVLPTINKADESFVEDPKPSNVEETLPPIARAVVMNEQIGEQAKDSSTEAQVAQRLLPSFIPSDMLGITKSEMRRLSPEQFVNEQQHFLLPETIQASIDENAPEETTFSSADEWDRLMNLATTEQHPNIVSYVRQMISDVPQISSLERLSISEEDELIFFADTEAEEEEPTFEIDLGAFELVDAGISAEELLANEDPVIYHRDMPVHSVHHDTVQTEAAIQNLMNASQSMLSSQIPPTMVADNYCFAIDADQIQMVDVLGDEHCEDLRHFYRVNLLTSRGKIISARLANTTPAMGGAGSVAEMLPPEMSQQQVGDFGQLSSFSMPNTARRSLTFCTGSAGRPSFAIPSLDPSQIIPPMGGVLPSLSLFPSTSGFIGRHSIAPFSSSSASTSQQLQEQQTTPTGGPWRQPEMAQRGEPVDLSKVYRVVRFYSFWRTCTSFHRIVTMIERVGQPPSETQSQNQSQGGRSPIIGQKPTFEGPSTTNISSVQSDKSDSSSAAKSTKPSSSPSRSIPDFQKRRLFVQYLWKNIKSSDKIRVQREFDPRRQRLLKCVADSAARKRMTGAKTQFKSGSAGHSMERHSPHHRLQPTPPNQSPAPRSGSIRFRLPPEGPPTSSTSSLDAPSTSSQRRLPRPRSSAASPLRRAKTEIEDNNEINENNSSKRIKSTNNSRRSTESTKSSPRR